MQGYFKPFLGKQEGFFGKNRGEMNKFGVGKAVNIKLVVITNIILLFVSIGLLFCIDQMQQYSKETIKDQIKSNEPSEQLINHQDIQQYVSDKVQYKIQQSLYKCQKENILIFLYQDNHIKSCRINKIQFTHQLAIKIISQLQKKILINDRACFNSQCSILYDITLLILLSLGIYYLYIKSKNIQYIFKIGMIEIFVVAIAAIIIVFLVVKKRQSAPESAQTQKPTKSAQGVKVVAPAKTQKQSKVSENESKQKGEKKKKKKKQEETALKNNKQLQEQYSALYYGVLSLKANNSLSLIDAVALKNSKILVSNSKNELVLYDLKRWKKDSPCQDRYFTSLDNNQASAIAIGNKYFYTALNFEKTVAYFQFLGGEKGVYFREVKRFARNLYKSDLSSLYVPESEKFIVGTGSGADTVINVWSMSGEKLVQVNSYQIQHYGICYGLNKILVRGWTSQVKLFQFVTDKNGEFLKVEKSHHLTHSQQAIYSAIDNLGLYAATICKSDVVKLWAVYSSEGHLSQKTIDAYQLEIESPHICAVHTLKDDNDRLRTFVVLANTNRVVICDRDFKLLQILDGVDVQALHMTGTSKNAVLGTYTSSGKMTIWNISSLLEKVQGYVLP